MRKSEERILREADHGAAFRLYFEEFVARHLVSDYRTLHTRLNLFRFRSGIVREAGRALRDSLTLRALAEAGLREGRAPTLEAAERAVRTDLAEILSIFEGLDRHLDAVAEIVARLERRIAAALRTLDHRDSDRIERTAAALRAVARADDGLDGIPDAHVSLLRPPIGEPHCYAPRLRRPPIESEPLPEFELDPAIEAFIAAKDAFRLRVAVTPTGWSISSRRGSGEPGRSGARRSPSRAWTISWCSSACARSTSCSTGPCAAATASHGSRAASPMAGSTVRTFCWNV